jgi:hypothetical protein
MGASSGRGAGVQIRGAGAPDQGHYETLAHLGQLSLEHAIPRPKVEG